MVVVFSEFVITFGVIRKLSRSHFTDNVNGKHESKYSLSEGFPSSAIHVGRHVCEFSSCFSPSIDTTFKQSRQNFGSKANIIVFVASSNLLGN